MLFVLFKKPHNSLPLYCCFPHEYCLCTLSVLGKVVSFIWVVRILLCWHFLFLKITILLSLVMDRACMCLWSPCRGGCSDRRWSWQSCWASRSVWPQNTRRCCIASVPDGLIEVCCGSTCQLCSFYLLLLPIAYCLAGWANRPHWWQSAVLGRRRCPRLLWTILWDCSNSGKKESVIPLIPGTDNPLLVTVLLSELDICIMKYNPWAQLCLGLGGDKISSVHHCWTLAYRVYSLDTQAALRRAFM